MERLVEKWESLDEGAIEEHAKMLRNHGVSLTSHVGPVQVVC